MKRNRLFLFGGGLIIIVLSVACYAVLPYAPSLTPRNRFSNQPTYRALGAARKQWAGSNITHYDLKAKLTDTTLFPEYCSYSVEVRNEEVVQTLTNTCSQPMPISHLFDWIQANLDKYDGQCGPNGCACDGPLGLDVTFEPQRGYPFQAAFHSMPQFASQYRSIFEQTLSGWGAPGFERMCTLMGGVYPQITEVTLTALPQ